jgi:hypothetical protein
LLGVELGYLFLVKVNYRLSAHNAGRNWRPLGVRQSSALARNKLKVNLLIFAQLHDQDGV